MHVKRYVVGVVLSMLSAAPAMAALAALVFFGVEEAAIEIEDPFGLEPNDLPLEQICATIARDASQLTKI